jgi:hypothetical protein
MSKDVHEQAMLDPGGDGYAKMGFFRRFPAVQQIVGLHLQRLLPLALKMRANQKWEYTSMF